MECPRCTFAHDASVVECLRCGVVFAKYAHAQESAQPHRPSSSTMHVAVAVDSEGARRELYVRALALPGAFAVAHVSVMTMPFATNIMAMWVHEAGHAVAAWLSGFPAFPGPWFTAVGDERSVAVTILLVGLLSFGAYHAWLRGRWFWLAAAVFAGALALFCGFALDPFEADQLITFSGDVGSLLLGTLLMLTMYAREDHPLRQQRLRWVFLLIGALAVVSARANWSGGADHVPFGEDERGLSDPSVLMEEYGWSAPLLIARYMQVANGCLLVLALGYVVGLADGYGRTSSRRPPRTRAAT
jgi:hypothetical protein